jgi:uncharacterized caspase-like protein
MLKRLFKAALVAALVPFAAGASPAGALNLQDDVLDVPEFGVESRPDDAAVIIGLEKYRDLPASDFSAGDAELVKKYVVALGFEEQNIQLLLNERATLTDIRKSLERWLPNRVNSRSRVFIYYSGHGSPEPAKGEAYMVPYDGDPSYLPDTAYPLQKLYATLAALPAAEVVVVMDSCFSGAGGRSVLAKGARPLVMQLDKGPALPPNMAVMSASQGSQISTSSPAREHGIFTYHLLKALREGKNGLSAIYEYVRPKVETEAKLFNVQQTPSITRAPGSARDLFKFDMDFTPKPAKNVVDEKALKKLQEEQAKIEAEKLRLAEEQQRLKAKEAQMQQDSDAKDAEIERRHRAERDSLQREKNRLKQQERDQNPTFVPPTF